MEKRKPTGRRPAAPRPSGKASEPAKPAEPPVATAPPKRRKIRLDAPPEQSAEPVPLGGDDEHPPLGGDAPRGRNPWWFDSDATMIAEIDPEGIPVGISSGNTRIFVSPFQGVSLRYLLISIWAVVLSMTLYAARDVQAFVLHDEGLAANRWLVATVNGLHSFATLVGPARLHAAIETALAPMKQKEPMLDARLAYNTPSPRLAAAGPARREDATARVLLVGASSMQFYLGSELERRLESYRGVVTYRFGKLGTGLARPDTFDWFKTLPDLLSKFKPTIVIGQFGGNDGQHLEQLDGNLILFGTEEWEEEYAQRLRHVAELVKASGARLVMLGMPITRHKKHSERLAVVNRVTQKVTEDTGGVYMATWDIAVDELGESRATITYGGKTGPMYLPDGVHYGRVGAAFVAERLCWRLERLFELVPEDDLLAVATRYEVDSTIYQRKTTYLAYVPQKALREDTKLPVLYLLHGEDGSWTDYSEHAHAVLQALATKHELIIVTPDGAESSYEDSPLVESARRQTALLAELMPDVERRLPVLPRRGIAGLSLGGNEALVLALKNPGTFASVSAMSGTLDLVEGEKSGNIKENRTRLLDVSGVELARAKPEQARAMNVLLTVGVSDPWAKSSRNLDEVLTRHKAPHELREGPGDHSWSYWVEVLPAHVEWHAALLHEARNAALPVAPSPKPGPTRTASPQR